MPEKLSKKERMAAPFMNPQLDLEERVTDLLRRLTLEEKFKIVTGRFTAFHTRPIRRLGIKPFKMTDGPHGLAGIGAVIAGLKKGTYFPVAICRCATWNPTLSEEFGKALASETRDIGYHMILAPGINIHRTPLCGRTFEYQTEDPYLNKKTAVAMVKGVQSQRIAVCVKHYACNNQEINRFTVNAVVSERALQEIYLPAFAATVQEADAWSFMACYNQVNGAYGCESEDLIRKRLMGEWGFRGFLVSDWGATRNIERTANCVNAGLSLEMPWKNVYKKKRLEAALEAGDFTEETLDENIRRLLRVMFLTGLFDDESTLPKGGRNLPEHQAIARKIAEEGIVLLKNDKNLLPLDLKNIFKLAVVGPNANKKMAGGGGSSFVRAIYEVTPQKGLEEKCKGSVEITDQPAEADAVIIFAGLKHKKHFDAENSDRLTIQLPDDQIELINHVVSENKNVVVVLVSGSPIAMDPWLENVPAVVQAWYAGCEAGNAISDVIFGDVNPSGKLPTTFPRKLEDCPAHKSEETYPGIKILDKQGEVKDEIVYYKEGVFVGYRYYDKHGIEPLFPFGHGLSFTSFEYSNLKIEPSQMAAADTITVSIDIKNTGERSGAEVVQLYLEDVESSVERPPKELKGFQKLYLEPGEKKAVSFTLDQTALSFYDETEGGWKAEKGLFKVHIGSSSRDIRLQDAFEYLS